MTAEDRVAFAAQMARLAEIYRTPVSELLAEEYFESLAPYGLEEVRWAVTQARDSLTFFPKPVELIDPIRARRRELAERDTTLALPSGPLTDEQRQVARTALARIRDLVGRTATAMTSRRPVAEGRAAIEDRKRRTLDEARRKGFQG